MREIVALARSGDLTERGLELLFLATFFETFFEIFFLVDAFAAVDPLPEEEDLRTIFLTTFFTTRLDAGGDADDVFFFAMD
jgi:hypothetical protein